MISLIDTEIDAQKTNNQRQGKIADSQKLKCGIIMPIAPIGDYSSEHWQEVKRIIIEATEQIQDFNFKTEIVSNSDGEINVIHKNIIQNIYNSDIVVCDISGRNPNVLFELGMRLTFDKPTILIKDDATDYLFDTGSIEHLTYPKDLRFGKIINFKNELALRIKQTYQKSLEDTTYSPFLGSFGEFKVPAINQTPVSDVQQLILDEISNIRSEFNNLKREINPAKNFSRRRILLPTIIDDVIYKYVESNNDFSDPKKIITKPEFHQFMLSHDIDLVGMDAESLFASIKKAQDKALPF